MDSIRRVFGLSGQKEQKIDVKNQGLTSELREVMDRMSYADIWFQMEEDQDLIEACIYQQGELRARYRYLMRQAKKNQVTISPFA